MNIKPNRQPLRVVATLLLALASITSVQAGVVYNWQTVNYSASIYAVEGRIEVDASLWAAGSLGVSNGCHGSPYVGAQGSLYPGCTVLFGIEDFYFKVNDNGAPIRFVQ